MEDYAPIHRHLSELLQSASPARLRPLLRRLINGLRQRQRARIAAQRNPDGSAYQPRKPRQQLRKGKRVSIKSRAAMFRKLRGQLVAEAGASQASVRFRGPSARIAAVHQFGEVDAVAPGGPLYDYPMRQLLGFSDEDIAWIGQEAARHLSG